MTIYQLKQRMDELEEQYGTRFREDVLLDEIVNLTRRVEKLERHGGNMVGGSREPTQAELK